MQQLSNNTTGNTTGAPDLVCLSHLRWDFVYQRPQHLLGRCARDRRVFFIEEPIFGAQLPQMELSQRDEGVTVVVPRLPEGLDEVSINLALESLINDLFAEEQIEQYALWYYTPMALAFTRHLSPLAVIYDCMDELSAFKGAPPSLREREADLFRWADLVFTGGQSLYEVKSRQHPNVHAFPSSVDAAHFAQARVITNDPADQRDIPHPRLGFFGVIDERMNLKLLAALADARPDWHLVMIGPVVKVDPAELPQRANIHYLGGKSYQELPSYLAGWDVALLPFALNESTRFISPTKTPEYMAAGKPVISTSIRDVVRPYGELKLVRIADTGAQFVAAAEAALSEDAAKRTIRSDEFLSHMSWDRTWARMQKLIDEVVASRTVALKTTRLAVGAASLSGNAALAQAAGD